MSPSPIDLTDDQLGERLRDLGAHLDLGPSATEEGRTHLVTAVLAALDGTAADQPVVRGVAALDRHDADPDDVDGSVGHGARHRRRPPTRLLVAAAVVVVVALALLTVAPARQAVARWLGIGGVRVTRSDQPLPTGGPGGSATPGDPDATTGPGGSVPVDVLARDLPFPVRLPSAQLAGEPHSARVDPGVASGLIEIRYRDVTLVELASRPSGTAVLGKVVGSGTTLTPVTVEGRPGVWITGDPHQLAFVAPDGEVELDTVRRAGDVLLWDVDGVTYRIEGAPSLDAALALADSLR